MKTVKLKHHGTPLPHKALHSHCQLYHLALCIVSVLFYHTDEAGAEEIALMQAMIQDKNCLVDPCSNNGTCVDGLDTFFCICASGYTGISCGIGKCSSCVVSVG